MNYIVLTEDARGGKKIYSYWIPLVNQNLRQVNKLEDLAGNHFIIYSGYGYPFYKKMIENAISDVNKNSIIDRLVIAVDSEENDENEKRNEILEIFKDTPCRITPDIVIQHFCIETWGLGNRKLGPRNPKSEELREYKQHYDVLKNDPESLTPIPHASTLNRAQFAYRYLRAMIRDKNKKLKYTKNNPQALLHPSYFKNVRSRWEDTGHIASFSAFITAFS
ncbi:MAG: hypothetical protein GY847_22860 [Proteobacteria bacterium]|nr:hypothetical protein [Pseudomonadota bacterium]